ncbi:MAG: hypothetical protein JRI41_05030 [Deltaproteobacteria bacterium]|nr:hypothetical protein [Deltaproteobacteria bacterium]
MRTNRNKRSWETAKVIVLGVFAPLLMLFAGCDSAGDFAEAGAGATVGMMGAGMAVETAREVLLKGIEGVDRGRSNVSMHPSLSGELSKAEKVAVLLSRPGELKMPSGGFMGGDRDIVEDSLIGLLMQMGYEVISSEALASVTNEASSNRLQALRELGTDLLISGAVVSGMDHKMKMGVFLGRTESQMKSVVNTASLRITTCQDGRVIMTATITYRKGKSAPDAARDLAAIIDRARHNISQ